MVSVAWPLDPTPASVEDLVQRMSGKARTAIDWFPAEFRAAFVEPLREAGPTDWRLTLDQSSVAAVRLFFRLSSSLIPLLRDPAFAAMVRKVAAQTDGARHQRILKRVEPLDPVASDDLREAYEWLRAILTAVLDRLEPDGADGSLLNLTDAQIRQEFSGRGGSFLRGTLLTVEAIEAVVDDRPVPPALIEWSGIACREMMAAANMLRAQGLPIPNEVAIPGFSREQWRTHSRSLTLDAIAPSRQKSELPAGVIERIEEVLKPQEVWLFGSRARGTHGPESDWDLMAVLPDSASDDKLDLAHIWRDLRDLRRMRVDVFPIRRRDFEEGRRTIGSLPETVAREGRVV